MTALDFSLVGLAATLVCAGWILFRAHRLGRVAARMEAQPTVKLREIEPPGTTEIVAVVGETFLKTSPVSKIPVAWCRYAQLSRGEKGKWTVFDEGGIGAGVHVWDATGDAWLDLTGASLDIPEVVVSDDGRIREVERRLVPGDRLYVLGGVSAQKILLPNPETGVKEAVRTLCFQGTPREPLIVRVGDAAGASRAYLRAARLGRIAALSAVGLAVVVSGYLAWVASL